MGELRFECTARTVQLRGYDQNAQVEFDQMIQTLHQDKVKLVLVAALERGIMPE